MFIIVKPKNMLPLRIELFVMLGNYMVPGICFSFDQADFFRILELSFPWHRRVGLAEDVLTDMLQ